MTIALTDIWAIESPTLYKVHFARWNGSNQPLEVFVRDRQEWQGWQEYYPGRNNFNRQYIFSLAQFYHEPDSGCLAAFMRCWAATQIATRSA